MNSKIILAFFGGAVIGAFISYKVTVAMCEKQVEEMMDDFLAEMVAYPESDREISDMTDEEYEARTDEVVRKYYPGTEVNDAKKSMIYRKPDLNKTPYNTITASNGNGEVIAQFTEGSQPSEYSGPYVILIDDYTDHCQDYEKLSLYYWDEDDTLSDDKEDIIPNVEDLIGDGLTRFGEGSMDPDIVYVRNDKLGCDYEVVRYHKSYQEEVYGIPPENNGSNKKRRMNDGENVSKDD